jgi:hypothetical protein
LGGFRNHCLLRKNDIHNQATLPIIVKMKNGLPICSGGAVSANTRQASIQKSIEYLFFFKLLFIKAYPAHIENIQRAKIHIINYA